MLFRSLFSCHRMIAADTIGQAITPSSRSSLRAHSMSSRRSKSFRFLQIISAANKQYAGARAPDRQQNQLLPLVFRLYSASLLSLHSQRLLLIVISQQFAAILVLFIGRRFYLCSMAALAASLNCCVGDSLDKVSWRLILRTVSFRNFS